jgi:hypothetical protein
MIETIGHSLPVLEVAVVEQDQVASGKFEPCIIGENLKFSTARLESYCLASWKPIVFDALLVAAAVEFCDRRMKRPGLGWGREFLVKVPVHDASHWASAPVRNALVDALQFLTGDRWDFEFVCRCKVIEGLRQASLPIPAGITAIIPFSDGMDSRAVATILERQPGHRLCRVRLGSKSVDQRRSGRERQPFTTVPYRVATGRNGGESSGRSRGFKFATVSGIAAYLVNASEIIVPESGQGALGPALVATGHGYEDYRNHPLFTDRMERYLKALLGIDLRFVFPRLWNTKGETLAAFAETTSATAHIDARSCWQQSRQVSLGGRRRQCGICAACMLRRLSVYTAGLTEPPETYIWEDLAAPSFVEGAAAGFVHVTQAFHEYAVAGTLHLDHLAELLDEPRHEPAISRHSLQLAKSRRIQPLEAGRLLRRLLTKHREEWLSFVESLGEHSFIRNWVGVTV